VISVDSGLGHLACALNLPIAGIYGPTDPVLTGPVGPGQKILVSDHLPCIPCLSRQCAFDPEAVTGVYPPCFEPLTPARVWEAFVQQLAAAAHLQ
jgi:heptosyltransferase-1